MAKARIVIHSDGFADMMNDSTMKALLLEIGNQVASEAASTAQDAQQGPGGTISGYAEAGFDVIYEHRGSRPRVKVMSLADAETASAAHFYTQKRDGVGHLRRALYKFTRRGA